jgi:hypothetical protein
MDNIKTTGSVALVGCGILKNEISYLINKNKWNVEPHFLSSSLHVDFKQLENALVNRLFQLGKDPKVVFYGTCHPNMNNFMEQGNALRTKGQNCVEILLGRELFDKYLSSGAFFLMEDWALHWKTVMTKAFGDKPEVIREIFSSEHKYVLALRTVCSSNYETEALKISEEVGLPLQWLDVDLDHLESVLTETIHNTISRDEPQ